VLFIRSMFPYHVFRQVRSEQKTPALASANQGLGSNGRASRVTTPATLWPQASRTLLAALRIRLLRTENNQTNSNLAAVWSPDGSLLATGSWGKTESHGSMGVTLWSSGTWPSKPPVGAHFAIIASHIAPWNSGRRTAGILMVCLLSKRGRIMLAQCLKTKGVLSASEASS
jgi:hypothetical protein